MTEKLRLRLRRLKKAGETPSLFHLSWPIFVELALQLLVGNVDQLMLSQWSQEAVAAVGNANQILKVVTLTFSFVSLAATILISQYRGANQPERVSEICTLSIAVNGLLGLLAGGLLLLLGRLFFQGMRMPGELMDDALTYLNIVGGAMVFQSLFMAFTAIFKSHARMRETMLTSVLINLVNVAGNFLLINGPGPFPALGVAGAAIASSLSRLAGLIMLAALFRKESGVRLSFRYLKPFPLGQLKRLLKIGIPAGGESLLYHVSQLCILSFINTMGTMAVTTRMYCDMVATISYLYGSAIAQGAQILAGFLIGKGDQEGANRTVRKTALAAASSGFAIALAIWLASDGIFGLFTQDTQILALAKQVMAVELLLELGRALNLVLVSALQAAGDIKFPVITGIASMWAVSVLLSWVFGIQLQWGLAGIWLAMAFDECLRGMIFLCRWKSGKWRAKRLI